MAIELVACPVPQKCSEPWSLEEVSDWGDEIKTQRKTEIIVAMSKM